MWSESFARGYSQKLIIAYSCLGYSQLGSSNSTLPHSFCNAYSTKRASDLRSVSVALERSSSASS